VTRDAVLAEGIVGGFGAVYPIYREMEERGRVRRGYFVEGLGGAQFALGGAVDRLRGARRDPGMEPRPGGQAILLAAADPADPYGAALPWPRSSGGDRSPSRVSGAYVVLHDGDLVLFLERGARSLLTFSAFEDDDRAALAVEALRALQADGRVRRLQVERLDGLPVTDSPQHGRMVELGWRPGYRGLLLGPAAEAWRGTG
jgi:ATP-dependent Lhr-like helicase